MITQEQAHELLAPYEKAEQEAWKAYAYAKKYGTKKELDGTRLAWDMAQAEVSAVDTILDKLMNG